MYVFLKKQILYPKIISKTVRFMKIIKIKYKYIPILHYFQSKKLKNKKNHGLNSKQNRKFSI